MYPDNSIGNKQSVTTNRLDGAVYALMAFAIFGILIIHTCNRFSGFSMIRSATLIGDHIAATIGLLMSKRFGIIFSIVFGIFYGKLLSNNHFKTRKYLWGCFVLVLIGLFNKVFYAVDHIMWYGLWGMALACFRNFSSKQLCYSFFVVYILNLFLQVIGWNDIIQGLYCPQLYKYDNPSDFIGIISDPVWDSVVYHVFQIKLLGTFSRFVLGLWLVKSGIIDDLKTYVNIKYSLLLAVSYLLFWYIGVKVALPVIVDIAFLLGGLCYAELFLLLYYKLNSKLSIIESYGKMPITNYSMQGIVAVSLYSLIFVPTNFSFELTLSLMLLFGCIQILFSNYWLKRYRLGPFEWLWNCLTEFKFSGNRRNL